MARPAVLLMMTGLLASCGAFGSGGSGMFGGTSGQPATVQEAATADGQSYLDAQNAAQTAATPRRSTFRDLFSSPDPNTTVEVNKYIWRASLDVLDFLPIESVDPFTGVIVTGYGTPPGGGRAYRATIYIQDPALDARSLHVALEGKGGAPVSAETQRAVEDAILARARQLRIQDAGL